MFFMIIVFYFAIKWLLDPIKSNINKKSKAAFTLKCRKNFVVFLFLKRKNNCYFKKKVIIIKQK